MERQALSVAHRISRWTQRTHRQGHDGPQAGGGPEKSDTGHAQAQQFAAPIDRTEAEDLFRTGTPAHGAAATSDDRSAPAASPGQDRGLSLWAEAVQFAEDDRNGEEGKQIKLQVTQQQQQQQHR
mmetsp:Transcript_22421/g.52920  ORF Transcript_22421/g.52920 Transcript_22421/m.52920 type:complete len:125 (-) Transcript_22421:13-387(-)